MPLLTLLKSENGIRALASYIAIALVFVLFYEYGKIQVWQHDSALYDLKGHFHKILTEGRWLNPYIASFSMKLGGHSSALVGYASLFIFFNIVFQRGSNDWRYSLVLSGLCIQATPLIHQLMWPVVLAPICLLLLTSALIVKRLPMLVFYCLYGVFFFATLSSFYYLLPLCHLYLLRSENDQNNLRHFFYRIVPCWAIGFILGYLSMKAAVYFFNDRAFGVGSFNLKIAEWREPNPVDSVADLLLNTQLSLGYFKQHLSFIWPSFLVVIATCLAFIIKLKNIKKSDLLSIAALGLSIAIAHYCLLIPLGLRFELRTALTTWIGINLILFYSTKLKASYRTGLMILAVTVSCFSLMQNIKIVHDYTDLTNAYLADLNEVLDKPSDSYEGVILIASQSSFSLSTKNLIEKYSIDETSLSWGPQPFRWKPVATEAGFKSVHICTTENSNDLKCINAQRLSDSESKVSTRSSLTTKAIGVSNGYLVIRFI